MLCPLKSCQNECHCAKSYGLLAAAVVLGLIVWGFKLNMPLFLAINAQHVLLPDVIWQRINFVSYAKTFILPGLLLLLTLNLRRDKFKNVVMLVVLFYVVFYVLKIAFHEARPFVILPAESFHFLHGSQNMIKEMYRSFPSGHTGNMAMFAFASMSLFCANSRVAKAVLFLLVIVVGLARIATGWHWPLDVLASGIISYILVQICLCNKNVCIK